MRHIIKSGFAAVLLALSVAAEAVAAEYVFAVPPRESEQKARETYQPIVDYLNKVTGAKFKLRYTDNWLTYQSDMRKDAYDLVFDGPQFIGWRMAKLQHSPIAKLQGNLVFVVIARNDNAKVKELKDLAGRPVCGFAPPNLATLTMYVQFDNPARQPSVREVRQNFKEAYEKVLSKECDGGVLQVAIYDKLNDGPTKDATQVLFKSKPVPNQGFSAGTRIPADVQKKIADALVSPEGQAATAKLRAEFGNKDMVAATVPEYEGLGKLLKDVWGFSL